MTNKDILIVEDTLALALIYQECLKAQGHALRLTHTGQDALRSVRESEPAAILLDVKLPDANGLDILKGWRSDGVSAAVIVITGDTSDDIAARAITAGADDFVTKPVDPERLQVSVINALEKKRLEKLLHSYENMNRNSFCGIVGGSPEMRAAYRMIESAAQTTAPVMVTGESGTGKELVAQAIHGLSVRKEREMVVINCAAIPRDLLESEIFGHVRGAFTGATTDRIGAAQRADKSTLFLDELGEMPFELQSKLLRFVQTGVFTPVGSSKSVQTDIRFISATNRNPQKAIQAGTLREDLYYRLAVVPLSLPPLRERGEDVILLAEHFLEIFAKKERKRFWAFDEAAKQSLRAYAWPGNVRELENIVRYAIIMHSGDIVTADMLNFHGGRPRPPGEESAALLSEFRNPGDIRPLEEIERKIIESAVAACGGNVSDAARRLGINPATIHRKQKLWHKEEI